MGRFAVLRFAVLVLVLVLVRSGADTAAGSSRADAVAEQLSAEIARVERELKKATSPEERANAELHLRRATDAVKRGRLYLALHELSTAWRSEAAYALSATLARRVKTADDFKREWQALGAPPGAQPATGLPMVVAALATASEASAPATYRASLPYAEDAGLAGGLYYLADSRGAQDFGRFCRTLKFADQGSRPPLRSITAEMDRFERDVLKLYDQASGPARRPFIGINVGMKIARERDGAGDHGAALLQYLLARTQLAELVTKDASPEAPARLSAFAQAATGADHTIAQLFLEMAAASLDNQNPDARRTATAIADFVLTEYFEITKR